MVFGIKVRDSKEEAERSIERLRREVNLTPEERSKLQEEFKQTTKLMDLANNKALKIDAEFIKVVEIPMVKTELAWKAVNDLVGHGYTIKGVIEREYWKTSLVILEKMR